jgi:hypothetical protein
VCIPVGLQKLAQAIPMLLLREILAFRHHNLFHIQHKRSLLNLVA